MIGLLWLLACASHESEDRCTADTTPPSGEVCDYFGCTYAVGERWAEDCNTCTCGEDSGGRPSVSCTDLGCTARSDTER